MQTLPFSFDLEPDDSDQAFVRVAVERGIDAEDGLTYRGSGVTVGDRVQIPLGRGNRPADGFVIAVGGAELLDGFDPAKVKAILSRSGASVPPQLVELGRWLAKYYVCPLGMVLSTMMPAAVKAGVGRRILKLVERSDAADDDAVHGLTKSAKKAWESISQLPAANFPLEPKALARLAGASNLGPINRLVEAGLLSRVERTIVRAPEVFWSTDKPAPETRLTLTPEQARAVDGIGEALGSFSAHLIRGVTGSGKTEVYLRLIERVLEAGNSALVLVPEIALTPQTAARFLARFQSQGVAVLHSGLSGSSRNQQWSAAASGEARVVVGARSAVFAPLPNLGLIVVDEEHDTSYKQDQLPRYNARDVAVKRAHIEGCPVVLGSATPSLESWSNAQRDRPGRYRLWELPNRVAGYGLPSVQIVDLAQERRKRRHLDKAAPNQLDTLGPTLEAAIERTIVDGGQVILLLNRRGFASFVACSDRTCGWSMGCDQCDASMVVHRKGQVSTAGYLRCHHCLSEQLIPRSCPVCQRRLIELGPGTQRLEEELEARFGDSLGLINGQTVFRVDSDTMNSAKDYFDVLGRFERGDIKVLLGTQMIAKGLDFPNVRLVGVVSADTALSLPDFRAAERTFQLVSQVAGRAGRGEHPGHVIVQTMAPSEPAIVLAAKHDFVSFARQELACRQRSKLPPAWRMVRIVIRDESFDQAQSRARELAHRLREAADASVVIQGPGPCPISRVAGHYRFSIEMTAPTPGPLQAAMASLRRQGLLKSDARVAVDVDPTSVL